jgi:hypothetical protein
LSNFSTIVSGMEPDRWLIGPVYLIPRF